MNPDDLYKDFHSQVVDTGIVGVVNKFLHQSLEKGPSRFIKKNETEVLEVGAGKGQHFHFVRHPFSRYIQSDIRAQNLELQRDKRVTNISLNAEDLSSFESASFDRIVATCLLVHLSNPETALKEWKRVIRDGGNISIYVPCEPGFLLRATRFLTTRRKARSLGYDHLSLHYREHVTYFVRLNMLINDVFRDAVVERKFFPFRIVPSWNINLWCVYQIRIGK